MAAPNKRTGTLEPPTRGPDGKLHYRGRIRLGDDSRHRFDVPAEFSYSEKRAREYVAYVQEQEDLTGKILAAKRAKANPAATTAEQSVDLNDAAAQWFRRWVEHKAARGQTSSADKWSHYVHHIRPVLGARHVGDWTPDDLRRLVATLDRRVSAGE